MSFRHIDTAQANGAFVTFSLVSTFDPDTSPYDFENDAGERGHSWDRDEWHYVGIQARADILIVRNGHGTMYSLTSPGIWGIESDSGEAYLAEVFEDEKETLRRDLLAIGAFIELPQSQG